LLDKCWLNQYIVYNFRSEIIMEPETEVKLQLENSSTVDTVAVDLSRA